MNISYTRDEKRGYFKKQMDDLKDNIEDKIQDFLDNSEELKKFIDFRNKHFKNYSINNSLLIYKQCPEASYTAGYNKWKELGYTVRKGSRAIKIFIPLIRKDDENIERTYGFKKGNVFDISQVEATEKAQELPTIDVSIKLTKDTSHNPTTLLKAIKDFIEQHCPVIKSEYLGEAMGMTNGKEIFFKPTKNQVGMAGVLVHEFYHYHNHYKENRKELTKDLKETEAELCTLIFGSYFNLDVEGTVKYLSLYRKNRDLSSCFEKAYKTFCYMIDGSDKSKGLEELLKEINY